MKKKKKEVTPFIHFDLEYKNELLNFARTIKGKGQLETDLASAVIYASFAEYLASYMLNNLRHLTYIQTYQTSGAVAFLDERKENLDRPINFFIEELRQYSFPDKNEFIHILENVRDCRNKLFHNFARGKKEDLKQIVIDIKSIQDSVELLVTKLNIINQALGELYQKVTNLVKSN